MSLGLLDPNHPLHNTGKARQMGHRDKECPHCHHAQFDFCCGARTREVLTEHQTALQQYELMVTEKARTIAVLKAVCSKAHRCLTVRNVQKDWPALTGVIARLAQVSEPGEHTFETVDCDLGCEDPPPGRHKHEEPGELVIRWKSESPLVIVDSEAVKVSLWNTPTDAQVVVDHTLADGRMRRVYQLKEMLHARRK